MSITRSSGGYEPVIGLEVRTTEDCRHLRVLRALWRSTDRMRVPSASVCPAHSVLNRRAVELGFARPSLCI
jgi:hypothetical protein